MLRGVIRNSLLPTGLRQWAWNFSGRYVDYHDIPARVRTTAGMNMAVTTGPMVERQISFRPVGTAPDQTDPPNPQDRCDLPRSGSQYRLLLITGGCTFQQRHRDRGLAVDLSKADP